MLFQKIITQKYNTLTKDVIAADQIALRNIVIVFVMGWVAAKVVDVSDAKIFLRKPLDILKNDSTFSNFIPFKE